MTSPLSNAGLIAAGFFLLAAVSVAAVLGLRIRDHLCERRLRRAAARSPILRDLLAQLEDSPSLPVRRRLGRKDFLADTARVERWVAQTHKGQSGSEPGDPFPDSALIDEYLVQIRKGSDEQVRAAAAGLLGWMASPSIVAPLLATAQLATHRSPVLRAVALRSLARARNPESLKALVNQLDHPDAETAGDVLLVLGQIGAPAVDTLVARLIDPASSASLRMWCARGLGVIEHHSVLPPLLATLSDRDAEVRAAAAEALQSHRDAVTVERLEAMLLTDPVPLVRGAVARSLGQAAPASTLLILATALSDPEVEMRGRVIEALEQVGPRAREILIVALSDAEPTIGLAAARALHGIGAVGEALDALADHGYDASHAEFLIEVGRAGQIEPLVEALKDPRASLPPQIVRVLARVGDRRAGTALGDYLDQVSDDTVQARVLDALRRVGDPAHALRATRLLGSRDAWLRKAAADYLADFGGPDSVDRIALLLEDSNPWTRASALRVFEVLSTHGIDEVAVRARLNDPYDIVRAQAVRTLCARRAFEQLLDHDVMDHIAEERLRDALLVSLAEHASVVALPLITRLAAFCADRDLDLLRRAAQRSLRELEISEIDLLLLGYADAEQESSTRWLATVAWAEASEQAAAAWREELLGDPDPRVRAGLVFALADRKAERTDLILAVHRAMDDPAPVVVRAALATVGRCSLHELESAVSDACEHEDVEVRVDATFVHCLLPNGAERMDGLAERARGRAQEVAATAVRLLMNDPAAVVEWLGHLRRGSDRRIVERWIRSEHALYRHMRKLAAERGTSVPASVLLCRNAFEVEERLAEVLAHHPHDTERRLALRTLASAGSERCLGAIRNAFFLDRNAAVRADALAHLVERNSFGRCRDFIEYALDDRDESVRLRAIRLCAMLPARETAALLAARLGVGDRAQRSATIERLAALLQEEGEELLDYILHPDRDEAGLADLARVLDHCAIEVCVPVLEELVRHPAAAVRVAALRPLLHKLGGAGWRIVESGMQDRTAKVRAHTLQAFASTQARELWKNTERTLKLLRQAHVDPDAEVRSRTALAVARLGLEGTAGILGALERDEDPRVEQIARRARTELDRSRQNKTPAPLG